LTVVLDSNVAVALAIDAERAPVVEERLRAWEEAKVALHAPSLFRFEVANAPNAQHCSRQDRLRRCESRMAANRRD
jgi:predicted nucleic acid-binding protein